MWAAFTSVVVDLAHFVADALLPKKRRQKQHFGSLYPVFDSRKQYYAANPETLKLRLLISSYDKEKLQKPLSAAEFILYRLKNLRFTTPDDLILSHHGFLYETLKGIPGVHTSITPKRYSVMEGFDSEQQPRLFFVESVFGDESLEVESVGLYTIGEFRYDVFTKKEWQEWRPVFISFNTSTV
jgi:hypothetical protein